MVCKLSKLTEGIETEVLTILSDPNIKVKEIPKWMSSLYGHNDYIHKV